MDKIEIKNYKTKRLIGNGQYGKVYLGYKINNKKKKYAIKMISKNLFQSFKNYIELFNAEVVVMHELNHYNILHLYEYIETENNYYLIWQYCNNGDLKRFYKNNKIHFNEDISIYFLMQMMNGIRELHKNKIMHRDIKLENILINYDQWIIGDFGFAKYGATIANTQLGTPITSAPEVIFKMQNFYNFKADLWSIGVCFYKLLYGKYPFNNLEKNFLINNSGINLKFPDNKIISNNCKDLIMKLLEFDPNKRLNIDEFFNHKLFDDYLKNKNSIKLNDSLILNNKEIIFNEFKINRNKKFSSNKVDLDSVSKWLNIFEFSKNNNFEIIQDRYKHEINLTLFILKTIDNFLFLIKKIKIEEILIQLIISGLILTRIGKFFTDNLINSIENIINMFDFDNFKEYCMNDNLKNYIMNNLKKNLNSYKKFKKDIKNNLEKKFDDDKLKDLIKKSLPKIDLQIKEEFNDYMKNIGSSYEKFLNLFKKHQFPELEKKINFLVVSYCLIINFKHKFKFSENGKNFNWQLFEEKLLKIEKHDDIKIFLNNKFYL